MECTNQASKLNNITMIIKKLDFDILGLCEKRWQNDDDFWIDDCKVFHSHGMNNKMVLEIS